MRAIILKGPGVSELVTDKRIPEIGSEELLIKVQACGVCATDLNMFKGNYSGHFPITPGHEFTGEVVEIGSNVTKFQVGDRVAVDPNESCGACNACRNAQSTFCESMAAYGVFTDGGLAEYAKVKEKGAYLIPEHLSPQVAAFVEPISCALHGIEQANIQQGDHVVIIGAGTMGQLLLQLSRNTGADKLIHVNRSAWQLEVSQQYGATDVIAGNGNMIESVMELTNGKGAEVVIVAVGDPEAFESSLEIVAHGGRIVQFGFPPEQAKAQISPFAILRKEITIVGSWINPYTFERSLSMLSSGKLNVDHLITNLFRLENYEEALSLIENKPDGFMKSIIMMQEEV